ncbi:MAG: hypothetical protein Q7J21_02820 [Rugosibacter sp.]|nr:hypothetical protein [Rugosibacter sp.]
MSQQINLLVARKRGDGSLRIALAALGLVLFLLLGFWGMRQGDVVAAQAAEAASALQLQHAQARLQAQILRPGAGLAAEIAVLTPQADAAQNLLTLADALGSTQGYARHFSLLTTLAEDGLWLTSVTVDKTGKSVRIGGHALRKESVMRYVQRLNTLFADDGVQFTALELSPVSVGKPEDTNAQLTAVAFNLY